MFQCFNKHAGNNYPQEIQVFNGMAQFCMCFIKKVASNMSLLTKLLKKIEVVEWIEECKNSWKEIKNQYV